MAIPVAGVAAAAGTVVCWTASAVFFERAGKRIGSLQVNIVRLAVAFALFAATLTLVRGGPIPFDLSSRAWGWLFVSGVVGMCLGDLCLFQAYVDIGPRLTMLVMSLVPPLTMLISGAFFDEPYTRAHWLGMAVTATGVGWVMAKGPQPEAAGRLIVRRITPRGLLLAGGAAVGQALGFVTAKHGVGELATVSEALAATQVRVVAGMVAFTLLFSITRQWRRVLRSLGDAPGIALTTVGAVVGPFLGVFLMMLAMLRASSGLVATIISLVPLVLIPVAIVIDKEHVSWQAVLGTVVAVGGVLVLVSG